MVAALAAPSAALGPALGPAPGHVRRWWAGQRALLGMSSALLATTAITALFGTAFWWVAAHVLPVAAVGYGSAAVSALTLAGTFGMVGMNTVLIPHLARRPDDAGGLLAAALLVAALASAALGAGFWLLGTVLEPGIAPYLHGGAMAVTFVAGSALTGVTLVLDEALLGMIGASPQLWRNAVFAVAKLAALAGLAVLLHDRFGIGILLAWTAGTALSVLPVATLLRRRGVRLYARPRWHLLRGIVRASIGNTWLNNTLLVPALALPMLVTGTLSAADGGAFYVAWTIVTIADMLPYHFTTALYASNAANPRGLAAKLRFTLRISALVGLAWVPLATIGAHPLLQVFGEAYAARATVPFELLVATYFGSMLKNHYIALCRISGQITKAGIYATASLGATLAAAVAGAAAGGLTGMSVGLLIVMTAQGVVVTPPVLRALCGRAGRQPSAPSPAPA